MTMNQEQPNQPKPETEITAVPEENAFLMPSFPCNSIPFLTRIREILDSSRTNSLQLLSGEASVKARACMWVLMGQLYGQMASIDLSDEWLDLKKAVRGQNEQSTAL